MSMGICRTCLGCNLLEDKNFEGKGRCEYYVCSYSMDHNSFTSNYTYSNKSASNVKDNKTLNR